MFHTQADVEGPGGVLEGLVGFTNTLNFPTPEQEKAGTQTTLASILGSIENIVLGTVLIKNTPKENLSLATLSQAAQQPTATAPTTVTPTVLGFPLQTAFLIAAGLVLAVVVFLKLK